LGEPLGMELITPPGCRAGQVTPLAQYQLDAQLIPKFAQERSQRRHEPMRLDQREVAEQHGEVPAKGGPVPERASLSVPALGLPVCGEAATASVRLIHHVVMHESELMQQLKGAA
jgi:hypothetical protein